MTSHTSFSFSQSENEVHRVNEDDVLDQLDDAANTALEMDNLGQQLEAGQAWGMGLFSIAVGGVAVGARWGAAAVSGVAQGYSSLDVLHNWTTETAPNGWGKDISSLARELAIARETGDYDNPALAEALAKAKESYPYQNEYSGLPGDDLLDKVQDEIDAHRTSSAPSGGGSDDGNGSGGNESSVGGSGDGHGSGDSGYVGTHSTSTGGSRTTTRVTDDDGNTIGYTHDITTPSGTSGGTFTESVNEDGTTRGLDIPIILDLDGNGVEVTVGADVFFDLDADGYLEQTSWASAGDGFLVIDLGADGERGSADGVIDQALEMVWGDWFGTQNATDLQVLSVLEQQEGWGNGDGVLNMSDSVWSELRIWQDLDQDGVTDEGELKTLEDWGISEISLTYDDGSDYNDHTDDITIFGNTLFGLASYTRDGEVVEGGVGDVGLTHSELGWRRVETEDGYHIELETGDTLRYSVLDATGSADIDLNLDVLDGAFGDDRANNLDASGHSRSVQISGGAGNDHLRGGNNDDILSGDGGSDTIRGYGGNDVLFVDADDLISGNVQGDEGIDTIIVTDDIGVNFSLVDHTVEIAYGGEGNDNLNGAGLLDDLLLSGGDGDDTLRGGESSDQISGDDGHDLLWGGNGDDVLSGGDGQDTLNGGDDDDLLLGGRHADLLNGGNGDDNLLGGDGQDTLNGGNQDDVLDGGRGADHLNGGRGDDTLRGGGGDDHLYFWRGDDLLVGGDGDDTFYLQSDEQYGGDANFGWAIVRGGRGNDTLQLSVNSVDQIRYIGGNQWQLVNYISSSEKIIIDLQDIESVRFADGRIRELSTDTSLDTSDDYQRSSPDVWMGDGSFVTQGDDQHFISGTNTYYTGSALDGWAGNDHLTGNGNQSFIRGDSGSDTISGNGGDDTLFGGSGEDQLLGGDGHDSINGGDGADLISGGAHNDTVIGGYGADWIWGDDGQDSLIGGSGADMLSGGNHNDTLFGDEGDDTLYGGSGNDLLDGGVGADRLSGGEGHDSLLGGAGADELSGGEGNDTLNGGDGYDLLQGDAGDDQLYGQDDNDWLFGGDGSDTLVGGEGRDILNGGSGADSLNGGMGILDVASYEGSSASVSVNLSTGSASGGDAEGDTLTEIESLVGSDHADNLTGDAQDNTLEGLDGNDTLSGGGGHDMLIGGNGDDSIDAGDGFDRVWGGLGADTVDLGDGDDQFFHAGSNEGAAGDSVSGGLGNDEIYGGSGDDSLTGDDGSDYLEGGDGTDTLRGGLNNDTLIGGSGNDELWGNVHNDSLRGGDGNDSLYGGSQNDTLYGESGRDALNGGDGDDTLDGGSHNDTLEGGTGADHLIGGSGTDLVSYEGALSGVVADFLIVASNTGDAEGDTYSSVENLSGSAHRDRLYANNSNNTLWGQNGDDDLHGRDGNDTLYGGNNNDRLNGGLGADRLDGGSGIDEAAYWYATSGVRADLSNASSNTGEAAGDTYVSIENISGSNHSDTLVGNGGNNTLWGRDGSDRLSGGSGNDSLNGGNHNDTLFGDAGDDTLQAGDGDDYLRGGAGADSMDGGSGTDQVNYEDSNAAINVDLTRATQSGGDAQGDRLTNIERVYASSHDDTVTGDARNNDLYGMGGDDELSGGAGNDRIIGGDGNDLLNGDDGADYLEGGSGADTLRGGLNNDTLIGGNGHDELWGNGHRDYLEGANGNDTLHGGGGDDIFIFNTGNSNIGDDIISDFEVGSDVMQFQGVTYSDLSRVATGNGVRIEWDGGSVWLEGVSRSSINEDDFVFV